MNEKNTTVATAQESMTTQNIETTTTTKKDNTPVGKVKNFADRNKRLKEREEQYRNFRINALKRRAKRMGLSEEQTKVKIEELKNLLDTPNSYTVLILFNPNDIGLIKTALQNEGLVWKIMSNSHLWIDADQETLATLRSIMPPQAKIHPYVKKKPPVLPKPEPVKAKAKPRTKAEKKALAAAAKIARKKRNIEAHLNHKAHAKMRKAEYCKKMRAINKARKLFQKRCQKASKKVSGTVVLLTSKKPLESLKKASTAIKKAA